MQADPLITSPGWSLVPANATQPASQEQTKTLSVSRSVRLLSRSIAAQTKYYIVQFTGPVQTEWKNELASLGAVFFDYVPQYAFILRLPIVRAEAAEALSCVRWIGEYTADLKLSPDVYNVLPDDLKNEAGMVALRVVAFPGENVSVLQAAIYGLGGMVLSTSSSKWRILLDVRVPIARIQELKDVSGVKWIEKAPSHSTSLGVSTSLMRVRSAQKSPWPVSGTRLYGEGQIVGICDSGLDTGVIGTMHQDFSDGTGTSRVVADVVLTGATQDDRSGHGTHVAGCVAGNGMRSGASPTTNSFPATSNAGVAPKAKLYIQSAGIAAGTGGLTGIPTDLADLFQPAYDAGARIHTNSWGTSGMGDYSSESLAVDQFMWDNKDFLAIYAAGNAGYDKDMDGVTDPYSIDTPATAKNCLSVGASESYRLGEDQGFATRAWGEFRTYADPIASDLLSDKPYGLAAFSSRGPTGDGRYKPEVVAPGTNILSTRSSKQIGNGWGTYDQYYYWSGGTSMATPLVAGAAALMREYLIKEQNMTTPSAALVKTSLIHSAASLAPGQYGTGSEQEITSAPDTGQGWGRVDLEAALDSGAAYSTLYHDVTASAPADTNYSRTFTFDVADNDKPFRTTLGWTDYPGSVAALGGLVNDLDLRVQKPDGTWVYPDNAVALSGLTKRVYVSSVSGFYTGEAIGLVVSPPSYPGTLETVGVAFYNGSSLLSDVSLVVYRYADGAVGEELFRKKFAYIPSGEYGLPVGVTIARDGLLIVLEKQSAALGVYYKNDGNPTGRGMIRTGGTWATASVTPALIANFRTQIPATDFDRVNNTVSVTLDDPEPGTYTAQVTAHNVPMGPQPYALVMSGMARTVSPNQGAQINPSQPDDPAAALVEQSSEQRSVTTVNAENNTHFNQVYSDQVAFSVSAPSGSVISMRHAVTGLPESQAADLSLAKLLGNGQNRLFTYADMETYSDGNWWLTDVTGRYVGPVETLAPDSVYYVVSVIKDNGPYDTNAEAGTIDDPQILGMTSLGLGAAGCNVGTAQDHGVLLLLAATLLSAALRCGVLRLRR